jgi:hypothetical protein
MWFPPVSTEGCSGLRFELLVIAVFVDFLHFLSYLLRMPRQPNTRPTEIYWLLDVRPETIANGWSNGYPFYCGKTIFSAQKRLVEHYATAVTHPHRAIAAWIRGCGKHIRVQVMETVPADKDWAERERWWIATLRALWPLCANTTAGGQGVPGLIRSRKSIEQGAAKNRGKKWPPERRKRVEGNETWSERKKRIDKRRAERVQKIQKRQRAIIRAELVQQRSTRN